MDVAERRMHQFLEARIGLDLGLSCRHSCESNAACHFAEASSSWTCMSRVETGTFNLLYLSAPWFDRAPNFAKNRLVQSGLH